MKLTTSAWIEERATTLATNARGRFTQSMGHPKHEVPGVTAQIRKELWAAYKRGARETLALAVVIGTVLGVIAVIAELLVVAAVR